MRVPRATPVSSCRASRLPARLAVAAALAAGVAAALAGPARAEIVAYRAAGIHPVDAPPVADGVLLVEDGAIRAVGPAAAVEVPAGTRTVDLGDLHLYPGFVHALSTLGLREIDSVRGTVDRTEVGRLHPDLRAEVAFHADSELVPVARSGGVLTAHVVVGGGLVSGTSAVMRLAGWNWQDMTVAAPVGMHLHFPDPLPHPPAEDAAAREAVARDRRRALDALDELFAAARAYDTAARAGTSPPGNPQLEALLPVLRGELPLFLHAGARVEIAEALDWAAAHDLGRLVLVSGHQAAALAERLAAAGVPVILTGAQRLPDHDWEPYDAPMTAAARLHAAGVRFAMADDHEAANVRNLPFEAAMAAAYGLPRDAALASITLWPAEILGVGDRLGSLAPGKEATFIAATGDPLDVRTRIERAWQAGEELDLSDRQKRLAERYRHRPLPAAPIAAP